MKTRLARLIHAAGTWAQDTKHKRWCGVVLAGLMLVCCVVCCCMPKPATEKKPATEDEAYARQQDQLFDGEQEALDDSKNADVTSDASAIDMTGNSRKRDGQSKSLSDVRTYESSQKVTKEARALLHAYQQKQDCLLDSYGYLDLFGNVWSCVVEGPDWVDVCVVKKLVDKRGSEVKVIRLNKDEWKNSYEKTWGSSTP